MAGKGRGNLLNDLVKENKLGSLSAVAPLHQEKEVEPPDTIGLAKKPHTAVLFSKRPISDSPVPSLGRGLMKPVQFMKKPQEIDSKTSALLSAEEYLKATVFRPVESEIRQHPSTSQEVREPLNNKASQGSFVKQQSAPTDKEKAEADAEWQRYKFQRQILGVLSSVSWDNIDDVFSELKFKIDECTLSKKYAQFCETDLVLESLVDKSAQVMGFIEISNHLISRVADYDVMQFEMLFPPLISRKTEENIRVTASNKVLTQKAQCFCMLLGTIGRSMFESDDERLVKTISSCIQDCIEQWTYPEGIGSKVEGFNINKAETHAHAATELFKAMKLQELENRERLNQCMGNLEHFITLIKESVMNDMLPRKIREVYLDIILAYAPRWQFSSHENNGSRDVIVESSPRNGSVPKVVENPGPVVRTSVSVVPSDGSDIQYATGTLVTSTNEESLELETDDTVEWKNENRNGRKSEIDDPDSCVVVDSTGMEQSRNDGSTYTDGHGYDDGDDVKKVGDWKDSKAVAAPTGGIAEENRDIGPFDNIRIMLNYLKLEDHMYRFEENVIRDTVLEADKDILKDILKEASFPAGVVYEILLYLEKSGLEKSGLEKSGLEGRHPHLREADSVRNTSSQYRYRSSVQHGKQKDVHLGGTKFPKKRLLGIGRGGPGMDERHKAGIIPRAAPWKNNKDFGNQRKNSAEEGHNLRIKESAGRGHALLLGYEKKDNLRKEFEGVRINPTPQNKSNLQDTKQVGKVEPLQRVAIRETVGVKSERDAAILEGSRFGSGSRVCLKCGNKEHTSYECTDVKSILI